jgi:hypothetical protein
MVEPADSPDAVGVLLTSKTGGHRCRLRVVLRTPYISAAARRKSRSRWPQLPANVKVERRAAALPQSKLLYPQPSIPSDAQRSYAACPLQRKLERTVEPCAYLKKDLPIAINRGVAIKTAAVIPAVASPEVSFTLLLSRNGIYTHCPVRLELAVKTMARRAPLQRISRMPVGTSTQRLPPPNRRL